MTYSPEGFPERSTDPTAAIIRIVGVIVMICGLYGAYLVGSRAWQLFEKPESIASFAGKIEQEARLNSFSSEVTMMVRSINRAAAAVPPQPGTAPTGTAPIPGAVTPPPPPVAPPETLNASYFVAWLLTFLLLGLVGRLSLLAMSEGGKLALYSVNNDRQLKLILTEILRDARMPRETG